MAATHAAARNHQSPAKRSRAPRKPAPRTPVSRSETPKTTATETLAALQRMADNSPQVQALTARQSGQKPPSPAPSHTQPAIQRKVKIRTGDHSGNYDNINTVANLLADPQTLLARPRTGQLTHRFAADDSKYFYDTFDSLDQAADTGAYDDLVKTEVLANEIAMPAIIDWAAKNIAPMAYTMTDKFRTDHLAASDADPVNKAIGRFETASLVNNLLRDNPPLNASTWITDGEKRLCEQAAGVENRQKIPGVFGGNQQLNTPVRINASKVDVAATAPVPHTQKARLGKLKKAKKDKKLAAIIKDEQATGGSRQRTGSQIKYLNQNCDWVTVTFSEATDTHDAILTGAWDVQTNVAQIYHYEAKLFKDGGLTPDNRTWWVNEDSSIHYNPAWHGAPDW